ncbi:MAG: tetratricopeptide repeat protein, partial [Steroidobacteraceae bacterium]
MKAEAKRFAAAHPTDVADLLVAAQGLASTRDTDDARGLLDQAARADPASPRPWIALGLFESALGRRDPADAAFRRALQADPRSVAALLGEAKLFLATGDPARAVEPLAKARALAPDDATVRLLSGALALAQGRGPDAVNAFQRLTASHPRSAVLQTDLARALVLARRPTDARAAIVRAVKLDPRYWPALVIDVGLALQARDLDAAQQLLPQLRTTQAPSAIVRSVEGDVAAHQGRLQEALSDYSAAATTAPSAALALEMASLRHALHLAEPDAPLDAWLRRAPHDDRVRMVLAQSLLGSAQGAAAARQYEAVLADRPKQLIALNNLAWLRLEAGRPDGALTLARQAYAIAPGNTSVEDTFGWALVQSGNATDALPILRSAHN